MEQIIAKADFQKPSHDDNSWHDFMEECQRWKRDNGENASLAMVINCWKTFQAKVCRPDFPDDGSCGYYMGYHLLHVLQNLVE
jgi:hypothetical protein